MKIDSTLNMPRMSTNVTTGRMTPDTSFAARVQSGVGTAANAVAGGVGVVANMVPGGSVVSAAVSSLTTFGNSSGSGSAPYYGAALGSGGVSMNTTVNAGGGISSLGGTPGGTTTTTGVNAGGGSNVAGEFNGEMQNMFTEQKKLLGMQVAMQKENQVFTTISNVLKTRHDSAKNSIGNIR
jgi:NaMN:DMB phosphoribosyltransferase